MLTFAVLAGCGYVGDPQPPALKIPVTIENLTAVQRGDRIVVAFTVPRMTTDGLMLKRLGEIDLRVGTPPNPWHQPSWEANATRLEMAADVAPGATRVETPSDPWAGGEVIIAVRASNPGGRWSSWSNLVALHAIEPLPAPVDIEPRAVAEGVRVTWRQPESRSGVKFRVYRQREGSDTRVLLGETAEPQLTDTDTRYGQTYQYLVLAVVQAGDDFAESSLPPPVAITPVDTFPPPVPAGFQVIAGLNTIELTWERDPGASVTYRLYRADGDGNMAAVAAALTRPSYSDAAVVSGRQYRYALSALDELGNESERTPEISRVAP